jgi:hypothetical protein
MPVNTGNSIGAKARIAFRASESLNELISGTVPGGTAGTTAMTAGGLAYVPAATDTTWTFNAPSIDPYVGSFSFFWYGEVTDNVFCSLAEYSGPGFGWNIYFQQWTPGNIGIFVGAKWGGYQWSKTIAMPSSGMKTIFFRFNSGVNTLDVYIDGVAAVLADAYSPDIGAIGSSAVFRQKNQGARPFKTVTMQMFEGALDDTERATLESNPFTIFSQPTLHGSVDATDSDDTFSASGSLIVVGPIAAEVAINDGDDAITSTGRLPITGTASMTDADDVMEGGTYDPYVRLRTLLGPVPLNGWVKANLNSFLDVTIPTASLPPSPQSLGNSASVIYAWSSFAWDEKNGQIVMFGGGHANYFGDEVYIWKGETGLWQLGSLPTVVDFSDTISGTIPSKDAPQSSHTYSNNVWLPNNEHFVTFGGAAAKSGGPMEELVTESPHVTRRVGPWSFDVSKADANKVGGGNGTGWDITKQGSGAWHLRVDEVDAADPSFLYDLSVRSHVGGATIVVNESGKDVAYTTMDAGGSGFPYWCKYEFGDIDAGERDTFSKIGVTSGGVMFDGFGVYDSKRGMMYRNAVRMSGNTADILALRVLGATGVTATTPIQLKLNGSDFPLNEWNAGTSSWVRECHYGCVYDPVNDCLWLWNGDVANPGRVYKVAIPAWSSGTGWASTQWVVTEVTPSGSTPRGNHQQGVLGKMRYVPQLGAFVVIDSTTIARTDDPAVWFFKTSGQVVGASKRRKSFSNLGTRTGTRTVIS